MSAVLRTATPFDRTAQKYNAVVAFGLALFCAMSVATAMKVMRAPTIATALFSALVLAVYGAIVARLTRQGRIVPALRYPGTFLPLFFLSLLKLSMLYGKLGYGGVLKDDLSFDAFFLIVVLSAFYGDRALTLAAGVTAAGLNLLLVAIGVLAFGIAPTTAVEAAVDAGQVRVAMEIFRCSLFVLVALAMNVISGHLSALLAGLQRSEAEARGVLESVARVQPQIRSVLVPIRETALRFTERASAQAGASRQIGNATGNLVDSVSETAANADEAGALTATTRADAESSNEKLVAVRGRFHEAFERVEALGERLQRLSESLDRTEAINRAIREISDRLRYLSINASLEAAKAGESGTGFAVIAREIQRLVEATGEDLGRSRGVLGDVREQIEAISADAGFATGKLGDSVAELEEAGALVDRVVASFASTAAQVESFATAATAQVRGLGEVSTALGELDRGAAEMDAASTTLLEGVERITRAHHELESLLAEREGTLPQDEAAPEPAPVG